MWLGLRLQFFISLLCASDGVDFFLLRELRHIGSGHNKLAIHQFVI